MLEELLNLKNAMKKNKPKDFVQEKWNIYHEVYTNSDKGVIDKINYREIFMDYIRYMSRSGESLK